MLYFLLTSFVCAADCCDGEPPARNPGGKKVSMVSMETKGKAPAKTPAKKIAVAPVGTTGKVPAKKPASSTTNVSSDNIRAVDAKPSTVVPSAFNSLSGCYSEDGTAAVQLQAATAAAQSQFSSPSAHLYNYKRNSGAAAQLVIKYTPDVVAEDGVVRIFETMQHYKEKYQKPKREAAETCFGKWFIPLILEHAVALRNGGLVTSLGTTIPAFVWAEYGRFFTGGLVILTALLAWYTAWEAQVVAGLATLRNEYDLELAAELTNFDKRDQQAWIRAIANMAGYTSQFSKKLPAVYALMDAALAGEYGNNSLLPLSPLGSKALGHAPDEIIIK